MKRIWRLGAMLLAVVMMLSACTAQQTPPLTQEQPSTPQKDPGQTQQQTETKDPASNVSVDPLAERYGGDLQLQTSSVSTTLDPHMSHGAAGNYQWMMYVYETPLILADSGAIFPLVCDYEYDMKALTLKLSVVPGKTFSDGSLVTIEDVMASIERAGKLDDAFTKNFIALITDKKVEADSVTYTFSSYNPSTLYSISSMRGTAQVMQKSLIDQLGDDGQVDDINKVVGTGCYKLTTYKPDTVLVLTRNENYVITETEGTGPAAPRHAFMDTITYNVNTDESSVSAALIAGDYHYANVISDLAPYAEQLGLKRVNLKNEWSPAIFFNLNTEFNGDSIVQNKSFRKAVRAALDMEAIMLSCVNGDVNRYILEPSPMSSTSVYYNTVVKDTEYNVHDQALVDKYLAEAGYNGEEIVWLCAQSASFYKAAIVGIQQLNAAGINCRMELVDSGSHSSTRTKPSSGHDIGAWETQKGTTVPNSVDTFITGKAGGWWENEEKTRILDILHTTEAGSEESIAAYYDFCELVAEEVPWICFGEMYTTRYAVPELQLDYSGTIVYWWNSYFTDK